MSERLEALLEALPQTQCQQCDFPGCRPYADALIAGETTIDRCAPGGLATLHQLAHVLATDVTEEHIKTVQAHYRPPSLAWIDKEACIGCTKCIQACPVDAIVGHAKQLHDIIDSECTGCELCLAPCPVDCIHLKPVDNGSAERQHVQRLHAQKRYLAHQERLASEEKRLKHQHRRAKMGPNTPASRQARLAVIEQARQAAEQHYQDSP